MATLADSFLQDLDDLDEISDDDTGGIASVKAGNQIDDVIPDAVELYLSSLDDGENVPLVSNLATQPQFIALMKKVDEYKNSEVVNSLSSNDEYTLIEMCNQHVALLDAETLAIYRFLKDLYSKQFPELESIVYSPLDYINVVRRLRNETDLTKVDLSDLLHNTVIMAVTVAASMTAGAPLPASELSTLIKASDEALHLVECRGKILLYLESRMKFLAPNLTAILGSSLTARLLTHAGGLNALARMPAQNLMLVGNSRKASLGFSTTSTGTPMGVICMSELVQGVPLFCRNRAIKYVCGKSSLAARVDTFHQAPDGSVGAAMRKEIIKALIKHQQPPPAPLKKTLPVPDEHRKSHRGGKRHRRMKEKYGTSDLRKLANRSKFGPEPEEEVGLTFGNTLGMIGKSTGTGKVKVQAKLQKVQIPNKRARQMAQASSNSIGGTTSSLSFTPIQGIELFNPDAAKQKVVQAGNKYFSTASMSQKS